MTGMGDIPRELAALFEPQVEQLGIRLERRGGIWVGEACSSVATGSMWLCAPSPHCLVLCHDVIPLEDMPLFEGSLGPYACACTMGDDAVACSRDCGLPMRLLGCDGRRLRDEVATFVEHGPRSLSSRLLAGHVYRSRSIIFLPDLFDELERHYPGEFRGLFSAFGGAWDEGAELAIRRALDAIPSRAPLHHGCGLGLLSSVTALMAQLASGRASRHGESETEGLARRAREIVSAAVEGAGVPPSVDGLARELYVSRSRLCEVFKRETGLSVGAYARKLRLERACRLLGDESLAVAEVAALLGYPSISAFCHAFTSALGMSPSAWRERAGAADGAPAPEGPLGGAGD